MKKDVKESCNTRLVERATTTTTNSINTLNQRKAVNLLFVTLIKRKQKAIQGGNSGGLSHHSVHMFDIFFAKSLFQPR